MSKETENAVASYVIEMCDDKEELFVNWFGGEPLLRLDTIERISCQLISTLNHDKCNYKAQITVDIPKSNKVDTRGREVIEKQIDNIEYAANILSVKLRVNVSRDLEDEFDLLYKTLLSRNLHKTLDRLHITLVLPVECGQNECHLSDLNRDDSVRVLRRERNKAKMLGFPVSELLPAPHG